MDVEAQTHRNKASRQDQGENTPTSFGDLRASNVTMKESPSANESSSTPSHNFQPATFSWDSGAETTRSTNHAHTDGLEAGVSTYRSQYHALLAVLGNSQLASIETLREISRHQNLTPGQVEDLRYVTADLLRADGKKGALLEETLERLLHSLRDVPDDTRNYLLQFAGLSKQAKFNRAFTAVIFGNRLLRCTKAKRASIVGRRQSSFCLLSKQVNLSMAVKDELDLVDSWDFDVLKLSKLTNNHPVQVLGLFLFVEFDLLSTFSIEFEVAEAFLQHVERGYHKVPYHNNMHAADVTQSLNVLLQLGLAKRLSELELLAILIAALCHDLGHRGFSNDYLVARQDPEALTYSDRHVNEMGHCASTFRIMKQDEANILKSLSATQFRRVREIVVDCILATDMQGHMALLHDWAALLDKLPVKNSAPSSAAATQSATSGGKAPAVDVAADVAADAANGVTDEVVERERRLLGMPAPMMLKLALHTADLSNAFKSLEQSLRWQDRILHEFFTQGDRQRRQGMTISPLCDRTVVAIPDAQMGFIDFIARPTAEALGHVIDLKEALRNLGSNREFWHARKQAAAAEEDPKEAFRAASQPPESPASYPESQDGTLEVNYPEGPLSPLNYDWEVILDTGIKYQVEIPREGVLSPSYSLPHVNSHPAFSLTSRSGPARANSP